MTARRSAIDAELVLHAEHVRLVVVQFVGRGPVGIQVLLLDFKAHLRRVVVAFAAIIDGDDDAFRIRRLPGDRLAQAVGECGDATSAGHIVAEKGDPP